MADFRQFGVKEPRHSEQFDKKTATYIVARVSTCYLGQCPQRSRVECVSLHVMNGYESALGPIIVYVTHSWQG